MKLNKEAYKVERDNLVYDSSHPIDGKNVTVTVPAEGTGAFRRGEILDFKDENYVAHTADGTASVIVAEHTPYAEGDTELAVPVYISGTFRKSACVASVELTETDIETLRSKGIYLK